MRLTDAEKEPFRKMRGVSELRTQFQCEYRLYLKQKIGGSHSLASAAGIELHRRLSIQQNRQDVETTESRALSLLVVVITIIAGILWILW